MFASWVRRGKAVGARARGGARRYRSVSSRLMRSLTYAGPRQLEWRDVPEPRIAGDGEAIVRHIAVATCDLDAMIVAGASPFPAPFALGHEGVAEVLDVGDGVTTVKPGDRVLVPFQRSEEHTSALQS